MNRVRVVLPSILLAVAPAAGALESSYLHHLATSTGVIPFAGPSLAADPVNKEVYVVWEGEVRIFGPSGMEVYSFGDDGRLGTPIAVAPTETGDILVLGVSGGKIHITRCDFRGQTVDEFQPHGFPEGFGIMPDRIGYAKGKVYLLSSPSMKLLVTDLQGAYVASFDLKKLSGGGGGSRSGAPKSAEKTRPLPPGLGDRPRDDGGVDGFNVDPDGYVLFTMKPRFRAYVLSPDGQIDSFGRAGGAPGKFNVVGGITRDPAGNIYVTDLLKSAVIVFNSKFEFLHEFGYRGTTPGSLITPATVVFVDGRVYVGQIVPAGVVVFRITDGEKHVQQ
jgi:hypothetical protein